MNKFFENIKKEDLETNRLLIESLSTKAKTQSMDEYYDFLGDACNYVYKNKLNSNETRSILEPFSKNYDMDEIIIILCRDYVAPKAEVRYIVSVTNDTTDIIEMLTRFLYERNSFNYSVVAENLLYCYQHDLTNSEIEILMQNLNDYIETSRNHQNEDVIKYLQNKRKFDDQGYQKPSWVSIIKGENISLLASVPIEDSEEDAVFGSIPKEFSDFSLSIVPDKKSGEKEFSFSELSDKTMESIQSYLDISNKVEREESKMRIGDPFRVWGPINKIVGAECSGAPGGKGPCRMLLCRCLDTEEDQDVETSNFFDGKCDGCSGHIKDISHSIRFPSRNGGWKGWFCSFKCLVEKSPHTIHTEENILIGIMKQNLETKGIMDRSVFC